MTALYPTERRVLQEIAEHGDITVIAGRSFLVCPVSPSTIDTLAAFEADELEPEEDDDGDAEPWEVPANA